MLYPLRWFFRERIFGYDPMGEIHICVMESLVKVEPTATPRFVAKEFVQEVHKKDGS